MFKNYFKTAIRNLFRHKAYTLINIVGLAIGMGVLILIMLFLNHELTYDNFFKNNEKICRVITEIQTPPCSAERCTKCSAEFAIPPILPAKNFRHQPTKGSDLFYYLIG